MYNGRRLRLFVRRPTHEQGPVVNGMHMLHLVPPIIVPSANVIVTIVVMGYMQI